MCPACKMFRNDSNQKMRLGHKAYLASGQIFYSYVCLKEGCNCEFAFRKDGHGEKAKVTWNDV